MKTTKIPAGYRLSVTSYEDDGDNYRTVIVTGLTYDRTRLLVDVGKAPTYKVTDYFGKWRNPTPEDVAKHSTMMSKIIKAYPDEERTLSKLLIDEPNGDENDIKVEFFQQILHSIGLTSDKFFTRVCQRFVVEYIPTDIIIEDVTKEFV